MPYRSSSPTTGDSFEVYDPGSEKKSSLPNEKIKEDGQRTSQAEEEPFRSHRGGYLPSKSPQKGLHGLQLEEGQLREEA